MELLASTIESRSSPIAVRVAIPTDDEPAGDYDDADPLSPEVDLLLALIPPPNYLSPPDRARGEELGLDQRALPLVQLGGAVGGMSNGDEGLRDALHFLQQAFDEGSGDDDDDLSDGDLD